MSDPARACLPADPAAAIALLREEVGPEADWLRALAAAHAGDALRAQIALRRALTAPLPPAALADVALPFAEAVLADAGLPAWLPIAAAVHDAVGDTRPVAPAHLAWELLVRATDGTAEASAARAAHVLALGDLARRLGRGAEARAMLRTCQELARRGGWPDLFGAATRALAEQARGEGDATLAEDVLAHGRRTLTLEGHDASWIDPGGPPPRRA